MILKNTNFFAVRAGGGQKVTDMSATNFSKRGTKEKIKEIDTNHRGLEGLPVP